MGYITKRNAEGQPVNGNDLKDFQDWLTTLTRGQMEAWLMDMFWKNKPFIETDMNRAFELEAHYELQMSNQIPELAHRWRKQSTFKKKEANAKL